MYETITREKFNALKNKENVTILGIESSCDETAVAIVRNGREILSNVVDSQIAIHRRYGGVVPEVASRNHTLAINACIDEALTAADMTFDDIDAIGVTYGAGLLGALLIGVSAAKALSYALSLPLIAVNHIEAHIAANFIEHKELKPPFMSVVASGGHTSIIDVKSFNRFETLGGSVDDAIGEAFDKVARILSLPYPGGPEIDKRAKLGNANIEFYKTEKHVRSDLKLSYSGLKTAVVNYVHTLSQKGAEIPVNDVCASFTKCAVDLLVDTAVSSAKSRGNKLIVLAGGVAANSYLREKLSSEACKAGIKTLCPSLGLCTDNAAMVAARAYFSAADGENLADLSLNAVSNLKV